MAQYHGLEKPVQPNWQGLVDNILRKGTPDRVYHIELFHDYEIRQAITERFGLDAGLDRGDPDYERKRLIAVQRFCGFDYVVAGLVDLPMPLFRQVTQDTAALKHAGGRTYQDERHGPIMSWEEFEKYPWPDPAAPACTRELEWYQENLPEDMCIIGGLTAHFCEYLCWLMGYETLCFAIYDQRDLVAAIARKLEEMYDVYTRRLLQFDRVRIVWGSDDMGYRGGTLLAPDDMREFCLRGHQQQAALAHAAGRPYILHSCGNLSSIIPDLVHEAQIDAKHSYEDTIENVCDVKQTYGRQIGILGGLDVDFLCRADEGSIRKRVRETLDVCLPGGGYCLGSGNSVCNYVPLENYLAMVDEGRVYGA